MKLRRGLKNIIFEYIMSVEKYHEITIKYYKLVVIQYYIIHGKRMQFDDSER